MDNALIINLHVILPVRLLPRIAMHSLNVLKKDGLIVARTQNVIVDVVKPLKLKQLTSRNRNVVVKVLLLLSNQILQIC